jgi:pyridoxine 4-dehydrogenase
MSTFEKSGRFALGDRNVKRLGYGAMQLAGPGVFGPPRDRDTALAVLREAVASGVDHIDTSDFYGPHVTNRLIREALQPYPDDLVIVTKIGARRGQDKSWIPAFSPDELTEAVHDNLRNLGLDALEVVNLRCMFDAHDPAEGSIEATLAVLADLQRQGLVRHIGLSNVTAAQIAEGRRICEIVCRRQTTWRDADAGRAGLAAPPRPQHPADPRHLVPDAPAGESGGRGLRAFGRHGHGAGPRGEHCGPRAGVELDGECGTC